MFCIFYTILMLISKMYYYIVIVNYLNLSYSYILLYCIYDIFENVHIISMMVNSIHLTNVQSGFLVLKLYSYNFNSKSHPKNSQVWFPNWTLTLLPAPRFSPIMVTLVPPDSGPLLGDRAVTVGVCRTEKYKLICGSRLEEDVAADRRDEATDPEPSLGDRYLTASKALHLWWYHLWALCIITELQ